MKEEYQRPANTFCLFEPEISDCINYVFFIKFITMQTDNTKQNFDIAIFIVFLFVQILKSMLNYSVFKNWLSSFCNWKQIIAYSSILSQKNCTLITFKKIGLNTQQSRKLTVYILFHRYDESEFRKLFMKF